METSFPLPDILPLPPGQLPHPDLTATVPFVIRHLPCAHPSSHQLSPLYVLQQRVYRFRLSYTTTPPLPAILLPSTSPPPPAQNNTLTCAATRFHSCPCRWTPEAPIRSRLYDTVRHGMAINDKVSSNGEPRRYVCKDVCQNSQQQQEQQQKRQQ